MNYAPSARSHLQLTINGGSQRLIPNTSSLLVFFSAALVLLMIPGPAVFYIVGRSIGHGRSAGLVSALGIAVGSLVHTAAAAVGLSALLMSSALAFSAVKYLGAAYLIYLGIQKISRDEPFALEGDAPRVKAVADFRAGHCGQRAQSEVGAIFLRVPAAIRRSRARARGSADSVPRHVCSRFMGLTSDSTWALTSGTVAGLFRRNPRAMRTQRYVSGGMLISLGVATAFAGPAKK